MVALMLQDTVPVVADTLTGGQAYALEGATAVLAAGTGILSSILLGLFKRFVLRPTGVWDSKLGQFMRPIQPLIVLVLSFVLPKLGDWIGLLSEVPNAELFVVAPLGAVLGIAAREIAVRLQRFYTVPA